MIKTWQQRTAERLRPGIAAQLSNSELSIIGTVDMLAEIAELRAALGATVQLADPQSAPPCAYCPAGVCNYPNKGLSGCMLHAEHCSIVRKIHRDEQAAQDMIRRRP